MKIDNAVRHPKFCCQECMLMKDVHVRSQVNERKNGRYCLKLIPL